MSERIYNFQDILYLNYYTEEDCKQHLIVDNLAIDMTWEYSCENAPYDLSNAVEFCNRVDNVVYRGYKYSQDSSVTFTTGVTFLNFTQTVQDAIDNKNGWTMKALAELFECEHRSRDDNEFNYDTPMIKWHRFGIVSKYEFDEFMKDCTNLEQKVYW